MSVEPSVEIRSECDTAEMGTPAECGKAQVKSIAPECGTAQVKSVEPSVERRRKGGTAGMETPAECGRYQVKSVGPVKKKDKRMKCGTAQPIWRYLQGVEKCEGSGAAVPYFERTSKTQLQGVEQGVAKKEKAAECDQTELSQSCEEVEAELCQTLATTEMCYTIVKGIIEDSITECGTAQPTLSQCVDKVGLSGRGAPRTTTESKKRRLEPGIDNLEICHTQSNPKHSKVARVEIGVEKAVACRRRKQEIETDNDAKLGNDYLKAKIKTNFKHKRNKNVAKNFKRGKAKIEQKTKITDFFEAKMPFFPNRVQIGASGRGDAAIGASQGVGEIVHRIKNVPVKPTAIYHMESEGGGGPY